MQAKPDAEELAKLGEVLGLQSLKEEVSPQWWPMRGGLGSTPPTDPVIYRLYEVGLLMSYVLIPDPSACSGYSGVRSCNQGAYRRQSRNRRPS